MVIQFQENNVAFAVTLVPNNLGSEIMDVCKDVVNDGVVLSSKFCATHLTSAVNPC